MSVSLADASKSACADALHRLRAGNPTAMARWLHDHLFDHVLPFWERHAIDDRGGILTCINDDGGVNSADKWMWSQWRAVWVFSRVYRSLDRNEKWLRFARDIAGFCVRHAWDPHLHHWSLLVAQDGTVLRGYESTYVDAFAIQALTELHLACGDREYLRLARETADAALLELGGARDAIPHFPYPIPPGAKPHAIPMIWSLVFAELGAVSGEHRYRHAAAEFSDEIFREFYRSERNVCLEYLRLDGGELPAPVGTAVVPGHVIEDMWFQIHVAKILGLGRDRVALAGELVVRHLELGWDRTHGGGILLAVDADGSEPVGWKHAGTKLWWPHTEALYATLLGWKLEGRRCFIDWHERLWRFCLEHYVDWQNGEWRQKLSRTLAPLEYTIALPVKDPFHLVRSLTLQLELLRDSVNLNGRLAATAGHPRPSGSRGPDSLADALAWHLPDFIPHAGPNVNSRISNP